MRQQAGRTNCRLSGGAVPGLVDQFERRLEEIHVQTQRPVQVRHGLPGNMTRVTIMTDETPYHGTVLLLDPGLVVTAVRPRLGELDTAIDTVLDQRLVDERAVVVRVDTTDRER